MNKDITKELSRMTHNTFKTWLQQHYSRDGAIKEHMERKHSTGLNAEILENNTTRQKNFEFNQTYNLWSSFNNWRKIRHQLEEALMLITTIHQHHRQHKPNTNTIIDRKQEICNTLNRFIYYSQGLLYHRTCKPDFLCSWPSLNSYLK